MTKSDSQLRIRQVAIVLSCVDASTKQRMLGQFPPDQARLVRQEIARLGTVDPQERDLAMRAFQARSTGSPPPRPVAGDTYSTERTMERGTHSNDDLNPAAALLRDSQTSFEDEMNFTPSTIKTSAFEPLKSGSQDPFFSPMSLDGFSPSSGAEIARLLENERPTVIATVLNQASTALGAAILAALPSRIAALTLSTLPTLESTDQFALREIHESLRQKLSQYRNHMAPDAPSVQRIQSMLAAVPAHARQLLEQDLFVQNSQLASSLGISLYAQSMTTSDKTRLQSPITSKESADISSINSTEFSIDTYGPDSKSSKDEDSQSRLTFDDLGLLPMSKLAKIFQELPPDTILIASTGAATELRSKLEAMIDPRQVPRLRARLQGFANVGTAVRNQARQKMVAKANSLADSSDQPASLKLSSLKPPSSMKFSSVA